MCKLRRKLIQGRHYIRATMISEPSFPRKKKHPELAYRTNEVLRATNGDSSDSLETETHFDRETAEGRARSEERNRGRGRASPRSKSVDPYLCRRKVQLMTQSYPPVAYTGNPSTSPPASTKPIANSDVAEDPSGRGTNPKSTEYSECQPRKSVSLGAIVQAAAGAYGHHGVAHNNNGATTASPYAHTRRDESRKSIANEEPAANMDAEEAVTPGKIKKFKTEYKAKFKSPTKYSYVDGNWKKGQGQDGVDADHVPTWYGEVLELRKKAGEYKTRAWGGNLAPEHIAHLWEQVSQRRVLSALALAAVPSSSSEAAKGPTKAAVSQRQGPDAAVRGQIGERPKMAARAAMKPSKLTEARRSLSKGPNKKSELEEEIAKRAAAGGTPTSARHHLERTTPAPGEMGLLLTSPTRDHKLEPAHMHRSMRDEQRDADTARASSARTRTSPAMGNLRIATLPTGASRPRTAPAVARKLHLEPDTGPKVHAAAKGPKAVVKPAAAKPAQPSAMGGPPSGQVPKKDSHETLLNGDRTPIAADKDDIDIEEPVAIIKSPPEPTRVKSPEQVLVKSPEPVKWTVPLETGSIQWSGSPKIEGDGIKVLMREEPRSPPTLTPVLHHPRSPPVVSPVLETAGVLTNGDAKVTTNDGGTSEF